jgi:hypothetical protein
MLWRLYAAIYGGRFRRQLSNIRGIVTQFHPSHANEL